MQFLLPFYIAVFFAIPKINCSKKADADKITDCKHFDNERPV